MAFERTAERLQAQIDAALADDEIRDGLRQAGLRAADVTVRIGGRERELWDAAASEIGEFEILTEKLAQQRQQIHQDLPKAPVADWEVKEWAVTALKFAAGALDEIARSRQLLAINPDVARAKMASFLGLKV
jgi:hypothetical protein